MQVNGVSTYTSTGAAGTQSTGYGSNEFMLMLLAQLRHQNPMEPMKDNEMMAQFTQLNSLQELQSIKQMMTQFTNRNQVSSAADLIGKVILAADAEGTIEGRVDGFSIVSGQVYLQVGEYSVPLSALVAVKEAPQELPEQPQQPPAEPEIPQEVA